MIPHLAIIDKACKESTLYSVYFYYLQHITGKSEIMSFRKKVLHFMHINGRRFLLIFSYLTFYMICFELLERRKVPYHIHTLPIDYKIPFCEYFIIPYYFWFIYSFIGIVFTIFQKRGQDFYLLAFDMAFGMTLFLIFSYFWPNGLDLRPQIMPRNNIFCQMVKGLYRTDTPTNVLPSIHVFNSIGVTVALDRLHAIRKHPKIRISCWCIMVFIILSTVFLKQHSLIDVFFAIGLQLALYPFVYGPLSRPVRSLFSRVFDKKHYSADYDLDWFGQ